MVRLAADDAAQGDKPVELFPPRKAMRIACGNSNAPAMSRISNVAPASRRMRVPPSVSPSTTPR